MSCCEPPPGQWKDVYGADVRPRRNGFECPLDANQIGAWVTIFILLVFYGTLHAPFLSTGWLIGLTIAVGVLAILTISLKINLSMSSNEEDGLLDEGVKRLGIQELMRAQAGRFPPQSSSSASSEGNKDPVPCYYCRVFVSHDAKHCSVCDKCVPGFDHHCRWLNTCVGERNYRRFFLFVCSALASVLLVFAVDLGLFVDALRHREVYEQLLRERYHHENYIAYCVFLALVLPYTGGGAIALCNLLKFHIYLWFTNQTTYKVIQKKKEKKLKAGTYVSTSQQKEDHGICALRKRRLFKKKGASATEPTADSPSPA